MRYMNYIIEDNNNFGMPADHLWEVNKGEFEAAEFFRDYLNSPSVKDILERLADFLNKKPHKMRSVIKNGQKAGGDVYYLNMPVDKSIVIPGVPDNTAIIGSLPLVQDGSKENEYLYPLDFALGHDWYHFNLLGLYRNAPHEYSNLEEILKEYYPDSNNSNPYARDHDSRPEEKNADLWGLKYLLYKEGIFDFSKNSEITVDKIKELRKKYPKLRPFMLIPDDEKIKFLLNHTVYNDIPNKYINFAKMGTTIKKFLNPSGSLNTNYPSEITDLFMLGKYKEYKKAKQAYDDYYGKVLNELVVDASKTAPTKTSNWTSEHNVAEDNKKYEQVHQAESLKIASAVSNKMNEVGNAIGTTALIGGMTIPALVASPIAFAGGMVGGLLGAKATDKVVDWSTDGKHKTWADWLVDTADTKYINHDIAEMLNPGALVGGFTGAHFAKPAASYAYRAGKYAFDTKLKGIPEGGNMEKYVPQTIKNQVEAGIEGTKNLLKELGVTDLPLSKVTYENNPIYASSIDNNGNITIGFDSNTLKNPFKFYKAYTGGSKAGLNYGFVGGHEYAHTVHPTNLVVYTELGVPINNFNSGISRDFPISELSIISNSKTGKVYPEGEYVTASKLLLEAGLFLDINTPRKNIMKGLPNKSGNQAHLRAPLEFDADLYALKNLGYIKDGKISDDGIKFLMERHNLSKDGVLNTLDDLRTIGYGNAVSGEPINGLFIAKPENIRLSGFAGVPKSHLQGDDAVKMFKEYSKDYVLPTTETENIRQLRAYIPEVRERYGLVGNNKVSDDDILKSLYKQVSELDGGTAARNIDGEPQLLFRGDTQRYTTLKERVTPEELSSIKGTMDNSLGNLFLGGFTTPSVRMGPDRYLVGWRYSPFEGKWIPEGSDTGAKVLSTIPQQPDGFKFYFQRAVDSPRGNFAGFVKAPAKYSESGVNDLNAFIVRTPSVRDATREISVNNDDFLSLLSTWKGGDIPSDGNPTRSQMATHYRTILDDASNKKQGLLKSSKIGTNNVTSNNNLRDEHGFYDYFALPNFNIRNAKHILPYDFRVPRNWNDPNIYKVALPLIGIGGVGLTLGNNTESYKKGGSIHIKEKNKGKFTEAAKRAGKSVQEHARDVVKDPKATKLQKKRALLALNAKKFKH